MKQRLVYIDVLRGICIFVVVYTHLVGFCTSDMPTTGVHRFLTLLFLQMFFFISGFVGYKDTAKWTCADIKAFLVKKVNTLLIPSVCAMSLNQFVCKGSLAGMWDTISGGGKRRLLVYHSLVCHGVGVLRHHGRYMAFEKAEHRKSCSGDRHGGSVYTEQNVAFARVGC